MLLKSLTSMGFTVLSSITRLNSPTPSPSFTPSCQCDPGWSGTLCDQVKPLASCAAWKTELGASATPADNEYVLTISGRSASSRPRAFPFALPLTPTLLFAEVVIWCVNMNTDTPKEYITLQGAYGTTFSERYKYQLPTVLG